MNSRQPRDQGGDWNEIANDETGEIGERKRPEEARIHRQPPFFVDSPVPSRFHLRVFAANL